MAPKKKEDKKEEKVCKKCHNQWFQNSHSEPNCRGARCGRCGEIGDHHHNTCPDTTTPISDLWPGYDDAKKAELEAQHAINLAANKKPPGWWKNAVLDSKRNELDKEGAKYLYDKGQAEIQRAADAEKAGDALREKREAEQEIAKARADKTREEKAAQQQRDTDARMRADQEARDAAEQEEIREQAEVEAKLQAELAVIARLGETPFKTEYPSASLQDCPKLTMEQCLVTDLTPCPSEQATDNAVLADVVDADKVKAIQHVMDSLQGEDATKALTLRTEFSSSAAPQHVVSNHFPLEVDDSVVLYHWAIALQAIPPKEKGDLPESEKPGKIPGAHAGGNDGDDSMAEPTESKDRVSRAIKKMVISHFIKQCPELLQGNETRFATDFVGTIVSWKDLFPISQAGLSDKQLNKAVVTIGTVFLRPDSAKDTKEYRVTITKQDPIPLAAYVGHARAEPNIDSITCNTTKIGELLNIFVARHVCENAGYVEHSGSPEIEKHCYKQIGTKFFSVNDWTTLEYDVARRGRQLQKGQAFQAIRAFNTTVVPGMQKMFLNVNLCCSAFYSCMTVAEFLSTPNFREAKDFLTRVRVYITDARHKDTLDAPSARVRTIQGFGKELRQQTFQRYKDENDKVGETTLVKSYLEKTYGWVIDRKSEHLPCVNIGGVQKGKESWCPADKLIILPYQVLTKLLPTDLTANMIDNARSEPNKNRAYLRAFGANALGLRFDDREAEEVTTFVRPSIMLIPGVKLKAALAEHPAGQMSAPQVVYANEQSPAASLGADVGKWTLEGVKFQSRSTQPIHIHVIAHKQVTETITDNIYALMRSLTENGLNVTWTESWDVFGNAGREKEWQNEILEGLDNAVDRKANLVILMLRAKQMTSPEYAFFKSNADVAYGLASACMAKPPKNGAPYYAKKLIDYMSNVSMKINLKFRDKPEPSRNHILSPDDLLLTDTLIIGADVTHPAKGCVRGTPSIAAVVGSADKHGVHYNGSMRLLQPDDDKLSREIIPAHTMQKMAEECLKSYRAVYRTLPVKIVFYRDGVSQTQYDRLKRQEVEAIRIAYRKLRNGDESIPASPMITTIVGEKRHHTRFFPQDVNVPHNCKYGTFVEAGPTSPYYYDFYLQAHNGQVGTVKPTHYFVILDEDPENTPDKLIKLTNDLSFVYQRATMPVSYATPTYYADHLAERGRKYLKPFFDGNLREVCARYVSFARITPLGKADASEWSGDFEIKADLDDTEAKYHKQAVEVIQQAAYAAFSSNDLPKYSYKGNETSARGPWHRNLDDTMFWL
ncbi:hypothetical protein Vi05172_g6618 [Venturia inaequalis]|nr:hypothetical protein Vi05172_g6618 [Venturia inaequalis]